MIFNYTVIDPKKNYQVNDEAIAGFKIESLKFYWRIPDANY